uniref:Uncharacterized protein n=1 Tax=Mastacembelus armatus TaxID=205130 RepID=A0A3Q3N7E7_9TELE
FCCHQTCPLDSVWHPPVLCGDRHRTGISYRRKFCGFDLPLFLSQDESGEVGVQLALLADPPVLHAVPPFLLSYPQSTGDVVAKVQPLLLCKVANGLVIVLHLQVTLAHEEMSFDRLAVQFQSMSAVCQSSVVLLQLHVAQRPVSVVRWDAGAVAGSSFHVLATQKEAVALLLQLLSRQRSAFLWTF